MTYDHDTKAVAVVTVADALEVWGDNGRLEHVCVLADALKEAHLSLTRAIRKGDLDAMAGAALRCESYADKLASITKRISNTRGA